MGPPEGGGGTMWWSYITGGDWVYWVYVDCIWLYNKYRVYLCHAIEVLAHICGHPVCNGHDTGSYILGMVCSALLANCRLLPLRYICTCVFTAWSPSKLRHCSPYTYLSCWFNLCCCPSKHSSAITSLYITFHPCCHQMCFPVPSILTYCSIWSYCRSLRVVFLVSTYSTKGCLSRQTSEELQLPGMPE